MHTLASKNMKQNKHKAGEEALTWKEPHNAKNNATSTSAFS